MEEEDDSQPASLVWKGSRTAPGETNSVGPCGDPCGKVLFEVEGGKGDLMSLFKLASQAPSLRDSIARRPLGIYAWILKDHCSHILTQNRSQCPREYPLLSR